MALRESAAWLGAEGGDELARMLLRLRLSAGITWMNRVAARGRRSRSVSRWQWTPNGCWGPDYPSTLASRDNFASARRR